MTAVSSTAAAHTRPRDGIYTLRREPREQIAGDRRGAAGPPLPLAADAAAALPVGRIAEQPQDGRGRLLRRARRDERVAEQTLLLCQKRRGELRARARERDDRPTEA